MKELTELLRNRRSLMVMFGVPLVVYPILTICVASLTQSKQSSMQERTVRVALADARDATHLRDMIGVPDNSADVVRCKDPTDAIALLKTGAVDAVIEIPKNFQADAIAGKDVQLQLDVDRSRETTTAAADRIEKILLDYQQWIVQRRLAAHGLSETLANPPTYKTTDIATPRQRLGAFLSYALPVLLLITGMFGAFYPGLSATTTERELGTLETLLATPATREELLIAKAALVLISGLLTALLNLVSMSLVLWRVMSQVDKAMVGFSLDPAALALSYLAAIPTLIFFTALVLMAGMLARNLREANAYGTPLMMLPMASMLVGIANPGLTPALLITPVINTTLIIRAVLTGQATFGSFATAFISSALFGGLMLSLTGRVFTNEQLVNPAWEPVSIRGLGRRRVRTKRWPAVDEILCLFAVSLLLNFYIAPSWLSAGLLPLLFGVEIFLIAGPAIVFAYFGRYPWRQVFSLRRPTATALIGGGLLGLGLIPLANGFLWVQQKLHILPYGPGDMEQMKLFEPTLQAHPWIAPVVIGLLAGICEEILFRGPIQAALVKRMRAGFALTVGGLLFAAMHMDLPGLPVRTGLGIVLGWIVWQTGAIWPAMLMHAVYDGVQLFWAAHSGNLTNSDPGVDGKVLAVGAVLSVIGWLLVRSNSGAARRL